MSALLRPTSDVPTQTRATTVSTPASTETNRMAVIPSPTR